MRGEVGLDKFLPALNLTARQVMQDIPPRATVEAVMQPWWLAPTPAPARTPLELTLTVRRAFFEREFQGVLELEVDLTLVGIADTQARTLRGWISVSDEAREPNLTVQFEDVELARKLGLPPSAVSGAAADPFRFEASLVEGTWRGTLSSLRGESHCELAHFPAHSVDPCQGHPGLPVLPSGSVRRLALDERADSKVQPRKLLQRVQTLGLLTAQWPDEKESAISVRIEPVGYACLGQGMDHSSEPSDVIYPDPPYREDSLVVPITLAAQSKDGRLRGDLPGFISARAKHDGTWDGTMEVYGRGVAEQILAHGGSVGVPLRPHHVSFLSMRLQFPIRADYPSELSVDAYPLYRGVPAFPEVSEFDANRAACFGVQNAERREIPLVSPPRR